jgi:carbon monoxide dehydrogenase subunit G
MKIKKHVEAPPETVFATAADFARAAEFVRGIAKVEMLTDGPVGVGTRFRETRIMFKREATEEMEVTAFDPPRSYALGCENHGCRYHTEITFTPNGSGTDVEMVFDATPLTVLAKVMAVAMSPMMKKLAEECGKDLDDLKQAVESS